MESDCCIQLCIVNLHGSIVGHLTVIRLQHLFHLTTYVTPFHRIVRFFSVKLSQVYFALYGLLSVALAELAHLVTWLSVIKAD